MLPDAEHLPSEFSQASVGVTVPLLVLADLRSPPLGVGLWLRAMSRAAVPETTVDEYGETCMGENDIHRAGGPWDQPFLDSESKAKAMQGGPQYSVGAVVGTTRRRHAPAGLEGRRYRFSLHREPSGRKTH